MRVIPKGASTAQKLLCVLTIQTCTWLDALWVTLRTARGAGFDDFARKYYDVAKVADLGRQIGPFRGVQSLGFGGQPGNSLNLLLTQHSFERG